MSYSEFIEAITMIPDDCERMSAGEIPDTLVESVQQKLGLKFSAEYLAFCRKFEYVKLDEMMICSIFAQDCIAVDAVLEERKDMGFPDNLLPFVDGLGIFLDFSVLDEYGEPRVVEVEYIEPDEDSEDEFSACYVIKQVIANDLGEFLSALVQIEQERKESETQEQEHLENMWQLHQQLMPYSNRYLSVSETLFYIKPDGSVGVYGPLETWLRPLLRWLNLTQLKKGYDHVVALRKDGTVVATGDNACGQCNTGSWQDIVAVDALQNFTIGLRKNGTVCVCGDVFSDQIRKMMTWHDVVQICSGVLDKFALRRDGTVVSTSFSKLACDEWDDIIQLCCTGPRLYGLTRDFRVRSCVVNTYDKDESGSVDSWDQVVLLFGSEKALFGVQCDGTVLYNGTNEKLKAKVAQLENVISVTEHLIYQYAISYDGSVTALHGDYKFPACHMDDWITNVPVKVSRRHCVGLRLDDTVMATGENYDGQCNVERWSNIRNLAVSEFHTVGLRNDGTVVATGRNDYGQCNVSGWSNVEWIVADEDITAAVRNDGTVLYAGPNYQTTAQIRNWRNVSFLRISGEYLGAITVDGRALICPLGHDPEELVKQTSQWRNVRDLAFTRDHVFGLTEMDKVLVAGPSEDIDDNPEPLLQAKSWSHVWHISGGYEHVVGVRSDGTVCAAGKNSYGQTEVEGWSGVQMVLATSFATLGLKKDGTVVFAGRDDEGVSDVSSWRDVNFLEGNDRIVAAVCKRGGVLYSGQQQDSRYRLSELNVMSNNPSPFERNELERQQIYSKVHGWEAQGRCRYCGGKLGLFKKCTSCKLRN